MNGRQSIRKISSPKLIRFFVRYGWLFPKKFPYADEAVRIRKDSYIRWKWDLENTYVPLIDHIFGMSFDLESFIVPLYLDRSKFEEFYDFVRRIFKSDSAFEFRAVDIRKFLDSRNQTSGIDIGSIRTSSYSTTYYPMRLNARRRLPNGISRIDFRATRISENLACISLIINVDSKVGKKPNKIYISEKVTPSKITQLGNRIGTSSVSYSTVDKERRENIKKIIDDLHQEILNSDLIRNSPLSIPSVKHLCRARIEIYKINNNYSLIFDDKKDFSRQSIFKALGINRGYYKHNSDIIYNFINLDSSSPSSAVVLHKSGIKRDWDYDLLGCIIFIVCRQLFIEHVSNKLYSLENSYSRSNSKQKIIRNYSDIISNKKESHEILDSNKKSEWFLLKILHPLDDSKFYIYNKAEQANSKNFLDNLDSLVSENIIRIDRLLSFINETRNYENLKYNYNTQSTIQIFTIISVIIATISLIIAIRSLIVANFR